MKRWLALGGLVLLVPTLLVGLVAGADTKEADWPTFRGANRDDHSPDTGLLKEWPKDGPPMAWKEAAKGMGSGYSSVAVAGDKVYTMGDVGDACFLIAVDRATGKKLWDAKVGKSGAPSGYAGPRCTPTVSGNLVYAEGQFGDLVCVDTEGKEQWRKSFPTDFKGRAGGWGFSESPLVDGDSLICTPGGPEATVVSLDKKTGAVQWKGVADKDEKAGYSSLVIAEIGKVKQYVTLLANSVSSFDAATGKLLWRYGDTKDRFAGNTANIPTCIVIKDQIFCCAGYGRGGALITITADAAGAFKAEEVYYSDKLKNKHGGVVLVGDYLYGGRDDRNSPFCAELKTGKVVDGWDQKNVKTKGGGSVSVTYADGRLYFRYSNGLIALAAATPDGYQEISTFKIPKPDSNSWPHPVVVGGKLWLREQDNLYCYDVKEK